MKDFFKAKSYIEQFYAIKKIVPNNLLVNYLILKNFDLQINVLIANNAEIAPLAYEILEEINDNNYSNSSSNLLGENGLTEIKDFAIKIYEKFSLPFAFDSKKYGRNEIIKVKYLDGTIVEKKIKQLVNDLESNRCRVIN
jgi:hypothetical protein